MRCCYCGFHNDATSHSCNSNLYCFHNKKSLAERMWHCLMDGTLEEASTNKKPGNYPQQTSISKFQLLVVWSWLVVPYQFPQRPTIDKFCPMQLREAYIQENPVKSEFLQNTWSGFHLFQMVTIIGVKLFKSPVQAPGIALLIAGIAPPPVKGMRPLYCS